IKVIAILLAIVAVIFTSIKKEAPPEAEFEKVFSEKQNKLLLSTALFEIALSFSIFIGSGMNDSLVNYASAELMTKDEFNSFNTVIFCFASITGLIVLLFRLLFMKEKIPRRAISAGILLGVPNYFSLLFLLQALSYPHWQSSVIFPINNMGIVILTAISAMILFRERLSKLNWIGMLIAISAITLLIFTQ
ncbi:MAG: EamA family transporter, partial [Chitinophagales bacterium]